MRVNGELKGGQVEQVTALPAAPQPTGRLVMLIPTAPSTASPTPYYFDGTAWQAIQQVVAPAPGLPSFLDLGLSGSDITIDWSAGLTQRLTLSAPAFVRFKNPQEGMVHTLLISQAPPILAMNGSNVSYPYRLLMPDQETRRLDQQDFICPPIGETVIMKWRYHAGIRTGYVSTNMPMTLAPYPSTAPASLVAPMTYNNVTKILTTSQTAAPFTQTYQIQDTVTPTDKSVFGARNVVTPVSPGFAFNGLKFSQKGEVLFGVSGTSPFVAAYETEVDKGALYQGQPNPTTLPAGAGASLDVHPNNFVAVGHATSPFLSVYPYQYGNTTVTGWGPRLANPSTLPTAQVNAIQFSPLGDFLTVSMNTTPFIQTYPFTDPGPTGTATIGAKIADPPTLPAAGVSVNTNHSLAWRPQGDYIAMALGVAPFLYVVPFNRTTGTYGIPLTIPSLSGIMNTVAWTPDGSYLLVGGNVTPFFYCFDFSTPGTIPATPLVNWFNLGNVVNSILVHPDGTYAWLGMNAGPSGIAQLALPTRTRNYLRLVE